ncbi:Hypothetical protein PHPALM_19780 [Phytophthora palmivora]|uniref:ATP-binding cassette (ABC) Superfamily n=1 Tax=Phytophthora palmivora TaxID=4796 RepID=A0A2P4XGI0_9STRA|nr:Hypothetical protein PHPALM_19780 [Phytophthora palmivora]
MRAIALLSWTDVHWPEVIPPWARHLNKDVSLFLENIDATRCVLLAPHIILLTEFTRLRKKSTNKGDIHPMGGFLGCSRRIPPQLHKSKPYSAAGCPVKEIQAEARLEFILIQRLLRIQFAYLMAKRQLVTEMEVLTSSTQLSSQRRITYEAAAFDPASQRPSGRLPLADRLAPMSSVMWVNPPLHYQLVLPGAPPLSGDTLHMKVELDITIKESRRSPHLHPCMWLVLSLTGGELSCLHPSSRQRGHIRSSSAW